MANSVEVDKNVYAVLFVDDEELILRSIRRAVMDENYTSYFAGSGVAALKIMEEHEINVIVTDMKMPGMDGLQLLKIIKEQYPNIVKIVLSGFTQLSQVLATVNQADIFNFIAKPWDMETELKYVIDKAIEHCRLKKIEFQFREQLEKRNDMYQTILKKMEMSSAIKGKQMEQIKKISKLLRRTIDKEATAESRFLVALLNDYADKLPGIVDDFSLETLVADLKLLVVEKPYYSKAAVQVKEAVTSKVHGSYGLIYFAVNCLLTLLQQNQDIEGIYIYIVTKEQEEKTTVSFSVFFLDAAGKYQQQLTGCAYQVVEIIFREIMEAKFVTSRKEDRQILQLEFTLDKV